ncbi:MAG: hypothetical protein FJZ59_00760 [Chlamydiae bacterium]|jgi:RIO-like serine/threonine protein kinase|nr:hypothetical protein [Chlamydiota bacterium]
MALKRLKWLARGAFLLLLVYFWPSLMHNVSRMYEALFLEVHYEYTGLFDESVQKELSWGQKIFCLNEYATNEVWTFLHDIERSKYKKVLWDHRGKLTEEAEFAGNHFIVKSATKVGFLRNIFSMGMGVNVWNNANWAKHMGMPVLKPVALVEKRSLFETKSFIVYLFEGEVCEKAIKTSEAFFPKIEELKTLLAKKHVIHHDFRLRNMVLLEDGSLQFIDIDKLHWYPCNSHVFKQRLKREVYKFNLNVVEKTDSSQRLKV